MRDTGPLVSDKVLKEEYLLRPRGKRTLPRRVILVRHGQSRGNVDETLYCRMPDPHIPLTEQGRQQACDAGQQLRELFEQDKDYKIFFYISPYRRSKETCLQIARCFPREKILGIREEVQLREQDFGNFQDSEAKVREKAERKLYSRFYYRFPNGESGADVYDRITIFEDHMVSDIDNGRFDEDTNLVLVTHGLTLRIFLARWFHWTVREFEGVYNPANSHPVILERFSRSADSGAAELCSIDGDCDPDNVHHTKNLYYLTDDSRDMLNGCTQDMTTLKLPEHSWERTLLTDEYTDEDDYECDLAQFDIL